MAEEIKNTVEEEQTAIEEQQVVTGTNTQNRFRSWAMWLSVLGALWTICSAVGLVQKLGVEEGTFKTVVDAVGAILIAFGIVNNPTSKGSI